MGRDQHAAHRGSKGNEAGVKASQTGKKEEAKAPMARTRAPDLALLRHQPGLISQLNRFQQQAGHSRQGPRGRPSNPQMSAAPKSGEGAAPTHQYRLDHRYVEKQ